MIAILLLTAACSEIQEPDPDADKAFLEPLLHHRILFMHRSVGGNLVRNGDPNMYQVLDELNATFGTTNRLWHHFIGAPPYWNRYYDDLDEQVIPNFGPAVEEGLGASPEYWQRIFCNSEAKYVAARDSIDNFRVIVFKSGYDNMVPYASTRCAEWREEYNAIKNGEFIRNPRLRVVTLGFPPIREGMLGSTQADADSAREFTRWLEEYWPRGRGNLYVFNLFDALAAEDNWLRDEYELDNPNDSHPNHLGCTVVGRALMVFLHEVSRRGSPTPTPGPDPHCDLAR